VDQSVERKEPITLTDQLRSLFKDFVAPIAAFIHRLGIHPNVLTVSGMLGVAVGSIFLAFGELRVGGLIILVMGTLDGLDGTVARLRGEPSEFGAFVDSVSDRYSELVMFAGLLWYFLQAGDSLGCILVYTAAAGSVLVSYTRAKGQCIGIDAKVGLMTRVERYIVIVLALIFNIPIIGLLIIAVGANITAIHRILYIRGVFRNR
jgi:CDP-diacylglycerol--glycerol-3-phosphate 3-phosphatidyltransferase